MLTALSCQGCTALGLAVGDTIPVYSTVPITRPEAGASPRKEGALPDAIRVTYRAQIDEASAEAERRVSGKLSGFDERGIQVRTERGEVAISWKQLEKVEARTGSFVVPGLLLGVALDAALVAAIVYAPVSAPSF